MSKQIKIEIKNWLAGDILFEYLSENNTIKKTVAEAIKSGADLLELLPSVIFIGIRFNPTLEKTGEDGWDFEFGQILQDKEYGFAHNKSLIDLLVGRIEWVVSNGYGLNL